MKDTVTNEVGGRSILARIKPGSKLASVVPSNMPAANRLRSSMLPVTPKPDKTAAQLAELNKAKAEAKAKELAELESRLASEQADTFECDDADTAELKTRFIDALTAHCKATIPLSAIVGEMIAAGVERDEAIDWGVEAGLSEGYVRSTVSSLYIALTGQRKKQVGGGRKANKGAEAMALRALKECKGNPSDAKALLLAARRLIEKWEQNDGAELQKQLASLVDTDKE